MLSQRTTLKAPDFCFERAKLKANLASSKHLHQPITMACPAQVPTFFKQTHAFFKENSQVKANMCKEHTLAAPQEYQPQAQTFFKRTHAFFKENAQVKASMCKHHTLAMPQGYQPLESGSVIVKDNGTEGQQLSHQENKGPLGMIKSCAHFFFTGPSIYPLIE